MYRLFVVFRAAVKVKHSATWQVLWGNTVQDSNVKTLTTQKNNISSSSCYRPFLFWMCFGNEAFYGLLYVAHFWPGPRLLFINFVPLLAALAFPVAALKSAISAVHLVAASQAVAEHDLEQKRRRKE
jgi:CDP-diacylglycerol--inositol 3-phosphatidyltransferase